MAKLENKAQKATRLALEALPEVVKATLSPIGYALTDETVWSVLVKKGLVEVNGDIKDAEGRSATRATSDGIAMVPKEELKMAEENAVTSGFTIEDVPVVETKRTGNKASMYPFDALEVGQSFFVPATEEKPEPWTSMKSTVASSNKRYGVPAVDGEGNPVMRIKTRGPNKGDEVQDTTLTRRFGIGKDEKDGVAGARIGRTA